MWNEARSTGADQLWRTKSNHILPQYERPAEGSYLSHLHEIVKKKRRPTDVIVRVVEYRIDGPGRPQSAETT